MKNKLIFKKRDSRRNTYGMDFFVDEKFLKEIFVGLKHYCMA